MFLLGFGDAHLVSENQSQLGAEAGFGTCLMQCDLDQKGEWLRYGQKGQGKVGDLLIGGSEKVMLKELQPPA